MSILAALLQLLAPHGGDFFRKYVLGKHQFTEEIKEAKKRFDW